MHPISCDFFFPVEYIIRALTQPAPAAAAQAATAVPFFTKKMLNRSQMFGGSLLLGNQGPEAINDKASNNKKAELQI